MNAFNPAARPEMVSRFVVVGDSGVTHHGNFPERAHAVRFAWGVNRNMFKGDDSCIVEVEPYRFDLMLSPQF